MNKAEEYLFKDKTASTKDLLALDKIKQDYPKLFKMICNKMEAYLQSRVKAISDDEIEAKAGCKSDRPYISQDQAIGIGIGIMWFKNKLLKQ